MEFKGSHLVGKTVEVLLNFPQGFRLAFVEKPEKLRKLPGFFLAFLEGFDDAFEGFELLKSFLGCVF